MKNFNGKEVFSFFEAFQTDLDCLQYLAERKWNDEIGGFACKKCGHVKCSIRVTNLARDCNKCHYVESPTACTLFHRVKFGLRKAFMVAYEMSTNIQGISATNMAERIGVSRPTAWLFMHKVRIAMENNEVDKIFGEVQVKTFAFGYKEDFRPTKSNHPKRKKLVSAVELTEKGGIKHAYFKKIENYSCIELAKLFDSHISVEASVLVEDWSGFAPLQGTYKLLKKENVFQNFVQTNRVIHDLKTWLRNVYTSFHEFHSQRYLDEFSFRLNRSNRKNTIFDTLIVRMINHEPRSLKDIKVRTYLYTP